MSEGAGRQLRIRPEFERRLALLDEDAQELILQFLEELRFNPVSPEDMVFAISSRVIHMRSVGSGLWVEYGILPDGSLSILTCGRYPARLGPM